MTQRDEQIAAVVKEMRAAADSYEGQAEGRDAEDFEFLMDLAATERGWADRLESALSSSSTPRQEGIPMLDPPPSAFPTRLVRRRRQWKT
jgi:hypothetical protein